MDDNEKLNFVKRHLKLTWDDEGTNAEIKNLIEDAEIALNFKLGAEIDYFQPSAERLLFLNFIDYAFNKCLDEFDKAYSSEIYQIRRKYEVKNEKTITDLQ